MMRSTFGAGRSGIGLGVVVALLGMVLLGVAPVEAGVAGSATPTFPVSVTVGDLFSATLLVINTSTSPNDTETVNLTTLFTTPSCKTGGSPVCLGGDVDLGVFKVISAVGDESTTPCANVTFTVGTPNPVTGEVSLTPTATVTLGPSNGPVANRQCLVNVTLRAFQIPTNPAIPPATTDPLTRATLVGNGSGLNGAGSGAAQVTMNKGTVGLTTLSDPNAATVVPGTSVTDTATVTKAPGAIPPTGSVRFVLCQPGEGNANGCAGGFGTTIGADIPIANGQATSEATSNTTTIGTYCWRARYLGDANYNAQNHFNNTTECFSTVKQTSTTSTQASTNSTTVVPGTSVSDTATVSGGQGQPTPTGTVVFFLCQPNEVTAGGCVSPAGTQIGSAKTLNNGQASSDTTASTSAIGTYCWRAVYSGDGFYDGSTHTNAASECFATGKQSSSTTTQASTNSTTVVPGTSVTDTATVSGGQGQPTPTGTVVFFLCQPNEVTAGGCVAPAGTQVGAAKTLSNGQATSDASTNTSAIGTYCWRAVYSGDGFYNGSTHTNAVSECFATTKQQSSTTTQASTNSTSVTPGTSVTDTATVSGGQGQPTPTGTVVFFLCQPNEVTAGGCVAPAGTQVGAAKTLSNGQATSDASTNTSAIGTYCWRAVYSGDGFYDGSNHTNAVSECFATAKQQSSTTTQASTNSTTVVPGASVTDTATVSGGQGQPTPTGTVVFFLCQPNEVTAGGCVAPAGTQVGAAKTLSNGQATSDASTNTSAIGTYCWRAVYSGDGVYNGSNHTNAVSECFATAKQQSSTTTQASTNSTSVTPGTSVTDTATVSGGQGQPTPTGTVVFFLCQPNEVTAGGCVAPAGTQIGNAKTLSNGQATSDASTNTNTTGQYCWRAVYSGDGFYDGSSHTNAASECFSVFECKLSVDKTCSLTQNGTYTDSCQITTIPTTVFYKYTVKNNSSGTVSGITGEDKVGNTTVATFGPFSLNAGASQAFTSSESISGTTTNVVTVSANGGTCTASDELTVVTACTLYYPYSSSNPLTATSFNESEVLREFEPNIASPGGTIRLFYNDEHTLSLGVSQVSVKTAGGTTVTSCTTTPFAAGGNVTCQSVPGPATACHAVNPAVGTTGNPSNPTNDATCQQYNIDPTNRPLFPAVFITDITNNPLACSAPNQGPCGDWQYGGIPQSPNDLFGTWKGATTLVDKTKVPTAITLTVGADTAKNNYNLGAGADPVPPNLKNEGFGTEIRWNVDNLKVDLTTGLGTNAPLGGNVVKLSDPALKGHTFRIYFMVHDGDQNKSGGDVGHNCLTVHVPNQ